MKPLDCKKKRKKEKEKDTYIKTKMLFFLSKK
jgi:hypothetical protein